MSGVFPASAPPSASGLSLVLGGGRISDLKLSQLSAGFLLRLHHYLLPVTAGLVVGAGGECPPLFWQGPVSGRHCLRVSGVRLSQRSSPPAADAVLAPSLAPSPPPSQRLPVPSPQLPDFHGLPSLLGTVTLLSSRGHGRWASGRVLCLCMCPSPRSAPWSTLSQDRPWRPSGAGRGCLVRSAEKEPVERIKSPRISGLLGPRCLLLASISLLTVLAHSWWFCESASSKKVLMLILLW